MQITEFFNPYNMEHIKAYKHSTVHGSWPEGFIAERYDYPVAWQAIIAFKMANVWVEQVLAGNVVGMPPVESVEPWDTEEWKYETNDGDTHEVAGWFPS
jgi:hypothetical protein